MASVLPPIGVTALIAGMAAFNRDAAIVEGRLLSINRAATNLERSTGSAFGGAGTAFGRMATTVVTGGTLITGALALAGGVAIKMAADFQQGLALTGALTGATAQEMVALQATITDLSRHGVLSMDDLAKAATELGRSGVSMTDIMGGALEAVQNLTIASGGELGLEKAAKLTATSMNAFGLTVDEVGRVTAAATVVAQNSALTFTDFGTGVQYAGATFKAAGFTIEDLAVAMAVLGKNGVTGSVAATTLRGVVQRLINPSKAAAKVMEQYGISLFDSAGNALGFDNVLGQLRNAFSDQAVATGKLTEEERLHAISVLGLQRTGAGLLILSNATTESLDKLRTSFESLSVTQIVERLMETLSNQVSVARNNVVALAIAFGSEFLPPLTAATKGLVGWLQQLQLGPIQTFAQHIIMAGAAIIQFGQDTVAGIRGFIDQLGLSGQAMAFLRTVAADLVLIFAGGVVRAVLGTVGAFLAFAAVIGTVSSIVAGITDFLAKAGYQVANFASQFGPAGVIVAGALRGVSDALRTVGLLLTGDFERAASLGAQSAYEFSYTLSTVAGKALDAFGRSLDETGAAWAPWAAQAGPAGQIVTTALVGTHQAVQALQFLLQGNFAAAAAVARQSLGTFGDAALIIASVVGPLVQRAFDAIGTAVRTATQIIGAWGPVVVETASAVGGAVLGLIGFFIRSRDAILSFVTDGIQRAIAGLNEYRGVIQVVGAAIATVLVINLGFAAAAYIRATVAAAAHTVAVLASGVAHRTMSAGVLGNTIAVGNFLVRATALVALNLASWYIGVLSAVGRLTAAVLLSTTTIAANVVAWTAQRVAIGLAAAGMLIATGGVGSLIAAIALSTVQLALNAVAWATLGVRQAIVVAAMLVATGGFGSLLTAVAASTVAFLAHAAAAAVSAAANTASAVATAVASGGFLRLAASAAAAAVSIIAAAATVIIPLAAVAAAVFVLYKAWSDNWFGIRDIAAGAIEAIIHFIQNLAGGILDIAASLGIVGSNWREGWAKIQSDAGNAIDTTKNSVGTGFSDIQKLMSGTTLAAATDVKTNFEIARIGATAETAAMKNEVSADTVSMYRKMISDAEAAGTAVPESWRLMASQSIVAARDMRTGTQAASAPMYDDLIARAQAMGVEVPDSWRTTAAEASQSAMTQARVSLDVARSYRDIINEAHGMGLEVPKAFQDTATEAARSSGLMGEDVVADFLQMAQTAVIQTLDVKNATTDMSTGVTTEVEHMGAGVSAATDTMSSNVETTMGTMQSASTRTMASMTTGILAEAQRASDQVFFIMSQMVINVGTLAGEAAVQGSAIGAALADGTIAGINAKAASVASAAATMVSNAVKAARSAAEASSPSRAMARLGEDMDEGLGEGLDDGSFDVETAAGDVADTATETVTEGVYDARDDIITAGDDAGQTLGEALIAGLDKMKAPVRASAASLVDDALRSLGSIISRSQTLFDDMQSNMARVGETVGRKINEAIKDAAKQIEKTIEDTNERIRELRENQEISLDERSRRAGLSSDQDRRREERKRAQEDSDVKKRRDREDADDKKKLSADLANAEFQLSQDLANATTDDAKKKAQQKYADKVADIQRAFALDRADVAARRALEDQDRDEERKRKQADADFERDLEKETQELNDKIDQEALDRSIARAEADRDARIKAINEALTEKQNKIREDGEREIKQMREQTEKKIAILEKEFTQKAADILRKGGEQMRPLVDNIQSILSGNFEAMRIAADAFTKQVEEAINALKRLEEARKRASFSAPSLPSPTQGLSAAGADLGAPPSPGATGVGVFDTGGRVPGPWGQPQLAVVHGGEYILSLSQSAAMMARSMSQMATPSTSYAYNVNANYSNEQSPASVAADMRAMILLSRR